MRTEEPFLMSRDARSVTQTKATKAMFTGPPAFPGRATTSPANSFSRDTNHETRITAFMFPCSRLFSIVQQKNMFPEPVSALRPPFSVVLMASATRCYRACRLRGSGHSKCQNRAARAGNKAVNLHFSPRGEAKCVRGPSGQGASRLARAGVLEQYVEHGKQAQRSPGGCIVCFDRRVVRNAG